MRGFPDSSVGKESTSSEGDPCLIPGSGRSTGEGTGYPFQCSCASFVAQLVKNLPANQGTQVGFLGPENLLEKGIGYPLRYSWASLVAQLVKNLSAMWETWVRSLGWEDPLEEGKATHSRFWPGEFYGLCSP